MLIKLDKILKYKITLLNVEIDLWNKSDLMNMWSIMTTVIINDKEFIIY